MKSKDLNMQDYTNLSTPNHNFIDFIAFTAIFTGIVGFVADYAAFFVGFSAIIGSVLGLYRIFDTMHSKYKQNKRNKELSKIIKEKL